MKREQRGHFASEFPYKSVKKEKEHIITLTEQGKLLKNAFEWLANEPEISQNEILRRLNNLGLNMDNV